MSTTTVATDIRLKRVIRARVGAFLASLGRPAAQARIRMLFERGFHKPGEMETRLEYHVGQLDS